MMKQVLIPGTSLRVSEMALGAMPWGTKVPLDIAMQLYEMYRAAGGNVMDTAHIYAAWEKNGDGASERAVGTVLKGNGGSAACGAHQQGGASAEPFYPRPDRYLSPEVIARDVAESLERMQMEIIDLFFVHRDDSRVPVGETIDALNGEVASGRIRYFGASNWQVQRVQAANDYAKKKGVMGFVATQPEFNLAQVNGEMGATDPALRWLTPQDVTWHEKTGMPAFCYSPAAKGYFASDGRKGTSRYENMTSRARLRRALELANTMGCSSNQIALAWLLGQRFPALPILGTGDAGHLEDAIGAGAVHLTAQQVAWLRDGD